MPATDSFRAVAHPVRVHAGLDALARLSDEVDRTGAKRVLVVCGQSVARRTGLLDRVSAALGQRLVGVFDEAETGSPLPSVEKGVAKAAESDADLIVAVGGGSAVVTARAIIILLAEKGAAHDLATKYPPGQPPVSPRLTQPKIPNILVLTTPTTAATRACTAVIDPDSGHRLELFDPKTRPSAIFWDSEAMLTCPPQLCLSAAASCYSGVIGGLQAPVQPNPLAQGDLLQALSLLHANLPLVETQPQDDAVRINLAAAAFLYNRAGDSGATGGGFGVVSALAHSLDTRFKQCSHGAAYSILTAPGMRFNATFNASGLARLASIMGVNRDSYDEHTAALAAADEVTGTFLKLDMPVRLSEVGVDAAGMKLIAQDAMTDYGLHRNARPVKAAFELEELLNEVF